MSTTNFTAIPKRTKLTFTYLDPSKDNGETITESFWGYHKGIGCPTPIVIDVDNIDVEYEDNYPTPEDRETLGTTAYIAKARRANILRFRDLLVTVVRNLPVAAADSLVSTDDEGNAPGLAALELLGWRAPVVEETTSDDESAEGEVQRVDETGLLPLQTPTQSTQD